MSDRDEEAAECSEVGHDWIFIGKGKMRCRYCGLVEEDEDWI